MQARSLALETEIHTHPAKFLICITPGNSSGWCQQHHLLTSGRTRLVELEALGNCEVLTLTLKLDSVTTWHRKLAARAIERQILEVT